MATGFNFQESPTHIGGTVRCFQCFHIFCLPDKVDGERNPLIPWNRSCLHSSGMVEKKWRVWGDVRMDLHTVYRLFLTSFRERGT